MSQYSLQDSFKDFTVADAEYEISNRQRMKTLTMKNKSPASQMYKNVLCPWNSSRYAASNQTPYSKQKTSKV